MENVIKMEPRDNENRVQENQLKENHIPLEPQNINIEIDEGLDTLRSLVNDLRGTIEPFQESLGLGHCCRKITLQTGRLPQRARP